MTISKETIEKQKDILIAEQTRLEKAILGLKKFPSYGNADGDPTQEVVDYENNLSIDSSLEVTLKKVKNALKAIENGTYGKCKKCAEIIESGRLTAMPYADVCVSCSAKK